jgi:signal transduction histidine kinase
VLTLEALATDGDPAVRQAFEQGAWDTREWPNLLCSLTLPSRAMLLAVRDLTLTPAEASWLDTISPVSHVLGVAFGDEATPQGILMLCWPDDEPLRFYETRLALALADQLALIAANRRLVEECEAQTAATDAERVRSDRSIPMAAVGPVLLGKTLSALLEQARPAFRAAGLTLRTDHASEARVALDASSLGEVVGALLDNARRFSRPGTRVRLWLAQDDAWATLYVADEGCGIPPAHQARIGEAGFQVDPSRGGSGTSLAAAKQLVTAAGGTFGFTSREGAGSTFYVSLPIARSEGTPQNA